MLRMRPLDTGEVTRAVTLATGGAESAETVARAARLSGGSVRQACKMLDEGALAVVEHIRTALDRLPAIDWADLHAVAEGLAGRANDAAFEATVETMFAWLAGRADQAAQEGQGSRRLAPLAEVWDKTARAIRETDAYNLDRRALVLTLFNDLSEALRRSQAA
jgi:DNA polymerase-3 subunit delta'